MHEPTDYGTHDHEASMARGELYNAIKNAIELFKMIKPGENLEGWVSAKITKAADYINTVHDYMLYEKQYGTNEPVGEEYMESLARNLESQLAEARSNAGMSKTKSKSVSEERMLSVPSILRGIKQDAAQGRVGAALMALDHVYNIRKLDPEDRADADQVRDQDLRPLMVKRIFASIKNNDTRDAKSLLQMSRKVGAKWPELDVIEKSLYPKDTKFDEAKSAATRKAQAKKYGSKKKGEKVAAAAIWKNVKR
jgi:hypothetical protein